MRGGKQKTQEEKREEEEEEEEEKKRKAAQPQMFFSVPFWTPKRNWGVGQSPTATAYKQTTNL